MQGLESQSFDKPDETRAFAKGGRSRRLRLPSGAIGAFGRSPVNSPGAPCLVIPAGRRWDGRFSTSVAHHLVEE